MTKNRQFKSKYVLCLGQTKIGQTILLFYFAKFDYPSQSVSSSVAPFND